MKAITFEKAAKEVVLDAFNKGVDKEGYVVEKNNPKQRVLSQDGNEIKATEFGGIIAGSEIFIKSDLISLSSS